MICGCMIGMTPTSPNSYFPCAEGTMRISTGCPLRSIANETSRLALPTTAIENSSHVATFSPSTATM